jgi:hypothetical protein
VNFNSKKCFKAQAQEEREQTKHQLIFALSSGKHASKIFRAEEIRLFLGPYLTTGSIAVYKAMPQIKLVKPGESTTFCALLLAYRVYNCKMTDLQSEFSPFTSLQNMT